MRLGWYLLIYAGVVGILGMADGVLDFYTASHVVSKSIGVYQFLLALIPLLASPIGALILRRSRWLALVVWTYLGFAIPMAIGAEYLLWRFLSEFTPFPLGTPLLSSIELFLGWLGYSVGNFWFAYLVALCGWQAPPEKLNRFWRKGLGVFLLLWGLLIAVPPVIQYWFSGAGQGQGSRLWQVGSWLGVLDMLAWLVLGWSLIRGKGWLPATAVALVMKVAFYTAQRLFYIGVDMAMSGWSALFSPSWAGWYDPLRLIAWFNSMLHLTLLELAPIALMLTFLMPAFPSRLTHYMALWRRFRRQQIERQRL